MRVEIVGSRAVKRAETAAERQRLGREAEVLVSLAHPGLVRLLDVDRGDEAGGVTEVATARAEHGSLAGLGPQPVDLVAGWGVAAATVLGDLHTLGWIHGAVGADHILLDEQGRPLLCGLGAARRLADLPDPDRAVASDLVDLAAVMRSLAAPGREADRLGRRLARWSAAAAVGARRTGRHSAERFIADVMAAASGARLAPPVTPSVDLAAASLPNAGAATTTSPPERTSPTSPRLSPRRRRQVGVAVGVLAAAGIAVGVARVGAGPGTSRSSRYPSASGEIASDMGPSPQSSGYSLLTPAAGRALTVLGRWGCGTQLPAVLYLADGRVWVFRRWPAAGGRVAASAVASVPGATGLAVTAGAQGCDQLLVLRAGASPVPVGSDPRR